MGFYRVMENTLFYMSYADFCRLFITAVSEVL